MDKVQYARDNFKVNEDGSLVFIGKPTARRRFGQKVGSLGNHGYLVCKFIDSIIPIHKIYYALYHGVYPEKPFIVDHKNRNKLDNSIENLRLCTYSDNLCNKISYNNTSGCKGVSWHNGTNKWRVALNYKKKKYNFGLYKSFEEAVKVCAEERIKLHGEFAKH